MNAPIRIALSALSLALSIMLVACTSTGSTSSPALAHVSFPPVGAPGVAQQPLPAGRDLYSPQLAQTVVEALVKSIGGKPIVRVVISRSQARITYIDTGNRPRSMVWAAGVITPSDDGTDLVAATSFTPSAFNLSDIASLFSTAARISGSNDRQELQINEYDHGQVLMTVTTTPESMTVFFDRNGVPIPRLTFTKDADLATGLDNVFGTRLLTSQVGITVDISDPHSPSNQVWVDIDTAPGVIERRMRTASMPAYFSRRRETPTTTEFDRTLIDPAVLAYLISTAPTRLNQPRTKTIIITISQHAEDSQPRIVLTMGNAQMTTTLSGTRID